MKSFLLSWPLLLLALFLATLSATAADVSITATSVVPGANAQFRYGVAGATITAGQLVYLDTTTNTWKLSDCNSATAAVRDVDGIAANSAGNGSQLTIITADDDLTLGGTVVNGTIYILSATPGGVAPAADATTGWFVCVVCVGKSTTKVVFRANPEIRSLTAL